MKSASGIGLSEVTAVYSGPEGDLWELLMGQQIHVGGFRASMDLAERAGIRGGMKGVDLCCCNGAGMRFLVRFRGVSSMIGVDATEKIVTRGRVRCEEEGLADRISFILGDACRTGLPAASADFVWGEDAWCYVSDKSALIAEAARIAKPRGTIAFTDWVEGPNRMADAESERLLRLMKFPNVLDIDGYAGLLKDNRCEVIAAEDTSRFAAHIDLYMNMIDMQLMYDALKIVGFNMELMQALAGEFGFMRELANQKKLIQARFIARRA